jgi:hypothetical protein
MKACVWCICALAMLAGSPIAYGVIVSGGWYYGDEGFGGPTYCNPTAYADGSNPSVQLQGQGANGAYTTEGCWADFRVSGYAYADGYVTLYNMECAGAYAHAKAGTNEPFYGVRRTEALIYIDEVGEGGQQVVDEDGGGPESWSYGWRDYFYANEGVAATVYAFAAATVTDWGDSRAYAHACVQAEATMSE